ncbi:MULTISPECIES: AraC family transcriptional regulator [unclassified Pseudoalteromonas]|uniref:AraC family transcriptional regulator n=1 Tax=unclassified Pseudoalteromonas TaxID=194690 RepID=UPI0020968117|nr:AraC family transcriptional regulator [Pseudoalteromonas sp. XMcav2-N]MCO7189539.1 helix-turn-helix domain-containing protein [Pseudoalteromonas sp. XMcav2-N]
MSTLLKLTPKAQPWIGSSDALFKLKQQIVLLAQCNLPVHIIGQPGSGKHLAVSHLHQLGKTDSHPLVVSCVNHWDDSCAVTKLESLLSQTRDGTLYLKNIDALAPEQAEAVKDYWLNLNTASATPRLITSTSTQKHDQALIEPQHSSFLSWLHYHCLELSIPSLAERQEDIPDLISHYKETCQHLENLQIDKQAMAMLTAYNWPHNAKQLKRCLDKLSFLSGQQEITKQLLISIFPAMNDTHSQYPEVPDNAPSKRVSNEFTTLIQSLIACDNELSFEPQSTGTEQFTAPLLKLQAANKPHPALARALQYIDENFKKPLSLSEVASYACVSPSHLSFLFKRYVGQSFKQTLLRIRIKTAMTLLREDPYSQVTEVCDDVGFSDLSFFVRKFKSVVGVSPGVYRDQRTKH